MITAMGDIIAAHNELRFEPLTGAASCKCGAKFTEQSDPLPLLDRKLNQHAARELISAGYGKLGPSTTTNAPAGSTMRPGFIGALSDLTDRTDLSRLIDE